MGERESMREREAESRAKPLYDEHFERMARVKEIQEKGKVVVRFKELPWEQHRQGLGKWFLHPLLTDRAIEVPKAPLMRMFYHEIRNHSGRHVHQGGLALFVVSGHGYTVANGIRHDWKPGDLILLPVVPGGIEHQHFNTDPSVPAVWLSLIPQMTFELLGVQLEQKAVSPDWKGGDPEGAEQSQESGSAAAEAQGAAAASTPAAQATTSPVVRSSAAEKYADTLWDDLFRRRDEQRREAAEAPIVVSFDDLPWEQNRQGRMRWYLHPAVKPKAINSIVVYMQEIPPGSRSGKVQHQGGRVFFVWKGRGYTVVNGVRHDWESYDLLNFPIGKTPLTYQHFNLDPDEPALLLACSPNFDEPLGVDMGVGLEQLENAPES